MSLPRPMAWVIGLAWLAAQHLVAGGVPHGRLIELHSCEVYAGGCVISSEAPQGGRYMLRAWDFSGGSFKGTDFAGLRLAVLQVSPDNLAAPDARTGDAVIYLPEAATADQRDALVAWLQSSQSDFHPAKVQTRVVPLRFEQFGDDYAFSAGKFISVKTEPMPPCGLLACGDALWYEPSAATSLFTVVVDQGATVSEPLLQLKWTDSGKKNVFLARFGEPDTAKHLYVTQAEVCGQAKALF